MTLPIIEPDYITVLPDGTVKQLNPFTATQVWTVPGRGNRPLGLAVPDARPLVAGDRSGACSFCPDHYLQTPPEKARLVLRDGDWHERWGLSAAEVTAEVADFRRVANLFEIVSLDYWRTNYGYSVPEKVRERCAEYLADPAGQTHVRAILTMKAAAAKDDVEQVARWGPDELADHALSFFGSGHDLIVARRHFTDDATDTSALASSGTLSPQEHRAYIGLSASTAAELYAANRYVRYVAVFQNWLKPAGASFDHLHKQLVAIDERGPNSQFALSRARQVRNIYNEVGPNYAARHNLVLAENDHAIAFAGFGHRYPSIEVYSTSATCQPWLQDDEERDAMADMVHAMHAATGADVPTNEEWHTQPIDVETPMPWRVNIKWRVSNLAGFEGGTKIYLNTISPMTLRDRVLPALFALRDRGAITAMRLGDECRCRPNPLRYVTGR